MDFGHSRLGETGELVKAGYEYQSGSNPHFLSIEEILTFDDAH
jgi:UDP-N-acetylglucosamine 4,6-dehydratase